MKGNPRIAKDGKFIRKISSDELPQFVNVLIGDMNLVGTRPPTVNEFKEYEGHHKRSLSMNPGIMNMWQAYGRMLNKVMNDFKLYVYWHLDITKQKNLKKLFKRQNLALINRADKIVGATPKHVDESEFSYAFGKKMCFA